MATGAGHRLRLHRPQPARSDAAAAPTSGSAIGYAIDREAIVKYLRRGFATVAVGIVPPMSWAFERERLRLHATIPARRGGCSTRPAIRIPTATARCPASASRSRRRRRRSIACRPRRSSTISRASASRVDVRSSELADALRRRAARQLPDVHAAVGRRDRSRHAAPRLSLAADAAGRPQSRPLQNAEVDRLIDAAASARRRRGARPLYTRAQQLIADDVPYISLWYKTNVAVVPARHPRRPAVADRRLHVPQGSVAAVRRGARGDRAVDVG